MYCLVLVTFGLAGCTFEARSNDPKDAQSDSSELLINEESDCQGNFQKVDMELVSCAINNSNPAGTYRFFSVCSVADNSGDIDLGLYIEAIKTKQIYQIQSSCFLNYRPVVQNKWISDDLIGFIIWSNPHYGYYFEVNMQSQNIEISYPVSDQPDAPPIPIQ